MKRLTYDFELGGKHCWQVEGADNLECREVCERQEDTGCKTCPIAKAFDRLAAIEDILGDEYELDRLRELVEADREGRCVVMEDLTISDLQQMLIVLDATCYGDGAETYTTGYRNGHRNGRIEILRHVLEIPEEGSSDTDSALKAREQDE